MMGLLIAGFKALLSDKSSNFRKDLSTPKLGVGIGGGPPTKPFDKSDQFPRGVRQKKQSLPREGECFFAFQGLASTGTILVLATTLVIGYYDYHLMTLSFACFISFQHEKRELEII